MKKRLIGILITFTLAMSLLAGCGRTTDEFKTKTVSLYLRNVEDKRDINLYYRSGQEDIPYR